MSKLPGTTTRYVDNEGRQYMKKCIRATFKQCSSLGVDKIVMFTATGEGPLFALRELLHMPDYDGIQIIAVTPPVGQLYVADPREQSSRRVPAGIPPLPKKMLVDSGIPVISAHLPFKGPPGGSGEHGPPSQWAIVERSFGILGGGFALCVQAALVACDAGEVGVGERVIALTSDTSIVVLASRTDLWLSSTHGLIVERLLCRPSKYGISFPRHNQLAVMGQRVGSETIQVHDLPRQLDVPGQTKLLESGEKKDAPDGDDT